MLQLYLESISSAIVSVVATAVVWFLGFGDNPIPPFPPLALDVGPLPSILPLPLVLQSGSGAVPQPKSNLVHFSFKI